MIYLLIIIIMCLIGLYVSTVIQKKQQKKKYDKEIQLIECAQCGVYIIRQESRIKAGKHYCNTCA